MKLEDLKGKTVGVCVSGGLDSKTICCVLKDAGVNVKAFSANVGQPDEKDINDIKTKMAPTGVETTIVDVTKEMAEICFETVKCQAMYDGGYWNSTGIARAVTVQKLLPAMKKAGCVALVHGATGRGNDQMRFERYTNVMDPKFGVYAPWRDSDLLKKFPGRTQMVLVEFAQQEHLYLGVGLLLRAVETGGEHLGVVEDEGVALVEVVHEVAEHQELVGVVTVSILLVHIDGLALAVNHHQARLVAAVNTLLSAVFILEGAVRRIKGYLLFGQLESEL